MEKRVDVFLDSLIDIAAESDAGSSVDIILFLPGHVISGTVISHQKYFELLPELGGNASEYWGGVAPVIAENHSNAKKRQQEIYEQMERAGRDKVNEEELQELERLDHHLIHLKSARLMVPGQGVIPIKLWRGNLVDVVGWTFGFIGENVE